MRRGVVGLIILLPLLFLSVHAEESVDLQMVSRIRAEGFKNSKVMETLSQLTDVAGPRLTGSPNLDAANRWSRDELTQWGLENAQIEPWGEFGQGWSIERVYVAMTAPYYAPLIALPKAWTPGTGGVVRGAPVLLDIEDPEDLAKYKGQLKDAIVMLPQMREAETHFEADARRYEKEDLAKIVQAPEGGNDRFSARRAEFRRLRQLRRKVTEFLKEEGAKLVLEASRGEHGTVFVSGGGSRDPKEEPALPSLVMAIEHFSRLTRLIGQKVPLELELDVATRFHQDDLQSYNVIAEIPGTDPLLKDELVMLGGHIDSWHAGTGATDNAAGVAVAMEAVRILKALNVEPRRTIRIALWSGEEQGLLGSRSYVKEHFAERRSMTLKPDYEKFSAYFNLDNGSGKIRGIYLQENDAVRPIFEAYLKPFHDLGADTVTIRNTGGTDHLAFDSVGLPGFQFIQDPLDYSTRTHHTNMDYFDHAIGHDLMQASVIMASFVYHTAMRDQKLPRKEQPQPEPAEQEGRQPVVASSRNR